MARAPAPDADAAALATTRAWVERVVIARALCPFAAVPYEEGDVLFEALPQDAAPALATVYRRAAQMSSAPLPATVLLVAPRGLTDFAAFLDFQDAAEALVEEAFPGQFVTASFHPAYAFADLGADDVGHYVHRSPYPVLQLLRRGQVAFAKTQVDIPKLLARNLATAGALGAEYFETYLSGHTKI